MLEIPLHNQNHEVVGYAKADLQDQPTIEGSTWSLNAGGYVQAKRHGTMIYLHDLIALAALGPKPPGYEVDHLNGDKTNNTRANLRLATRQQNSFNRSGPNSNNTTGYRGVTKEGKRFRASYMVHGVTFHVGSYPTAEQAAEAVTEARNDALEHV